MNRTGSALNQIRFSLVLTIDLEILEYLSTKAHDYYNLVFVINGKNFYGKNFFIFMNIELEKDFFLKRNSLKINKNKY